MPATKFACPECGAVLRTNNPIPEGKRVKCPKCGTLFVPQPEVEIEGADVVEDDALPARPAPRPRPADAPRRPRRARAIEDDADELPEDEQIEDRPVKRRKGTLKKKHSTGGKQGLVIGIIGGVLLLVLLALGGVAAFVWPGFLRSGVNRGTGDEDPLAYVPADSGQVFSVDVHSLLSDPALATALEPVLRNVKSDALVGAVMRETGLDFGDLCERVVIAGKAQGGPGGMSPGAREEIALLAVRSHKSFDQTLVRKAFKEPKSQRLEGKTYFTINEQFSASPNSARATFSTLFMPSDRVIVLATLPEDQLKSLMASDGSQVHLKSELQGLYKRMDKAQVWLAAEMPSTGANPAVPGLAMPQMRAVGVMGRFEDNKDVGFSVSLVCGSENDAKKMMGFAQLSSTMGGWGGGMPGAPPEVQQALKEVMRNMKYNVEGSTFHADTKLSRQLVEELLKKAPTLTAGAMMGLPGGPPANMPPTTPPQPGRRGPAPGRGRGEPP
jgi:predicted Zn finger-like uncharacterized protein